MALGKAIDESAHCKVYGDLMATHPELLERLKCDLVTATADAVDAMFGEPAEPQGDAIEPDKEEG